MMTDQKLWQNLKVLEPVLKADQKQWCREGRRSAEEELGREVSSSYFPRLSWYRSVENLLLRESRGERICLEEYGGEWGFLLRGVTWEVSMKFVERLQLKLTREPQYPIYLCKRQRKTQVGRCYIVRTSTSLLSKAEKQQQGLRFKCVRKRCIQILFACS